MTPAKTSVSSPPPTLKRAATQALEIDNASVAPEPEPEPTTQLSFTLDPNDARHLAVLCGQLDGHLRQIEERLGVSINNRSNHFTVEGGPDVATATVALLRSLYEEVQGGINLSPESIHLQSATGRHGAPSGAA